jgi:carbamoyl-phosphate synthase large subunit
MGGFSNQMNILVTGFAGDIAQSIVRVLRSVYKDCRITGCDIDLDPFTASLADMSFISLASESDNYMQSISNMCVSERIDLVIPVTEAEIEIISNHREEITTNILIANKLAIEVGLDKFQTSQFISLLGNYAPRTYLELNSNQIDFPIILKPRRGHGSQNVFKCSTKDEVDFYKTKIQSPIFQEFLQPSNMEVTCGVYSGSDGKIFSIQLLRKLSGGRTLWARVINDQEIANLCHKIAENLELKGAINVQLIITDEGPKVFEINPRYSSTVEMRHKLGFTDLIWGINQTMGMEKAIISPNVIGRLVGRRDEIRVVDF